MSDAVALRIRLVGILVFLSCAAIVTLASLFLMQALIQSGESATEVAPDVRFAEYIRTQEVRDLGIKRRKVKPLPLPDRPPDLAPPKDLNASAGGHLEGWSWDVERPTLDLGRSSLFGANLMLHSGEYLPIVKVEPVYPRQAVARSIEGWVLLEFTVTELGNVIDPVVIGNCAHSMHDPGPCENRPAPIFDDAALRAAEKFRYKPRVVDGVPIAVAGVQNKIFFELLRPTKE